MSFDFAALHVDVMIILILYRLSPSTTSLLIISASANCQWDCCAQDVTNDVLSRFLHTHLY
jgi:hypothetical protein